MHNQLIPPQWSCPTPVVSQHYPTSAVSQQQPWNYPTPAVLQQQAWNVQPPAPDRLIRPQSGPAQQNGAAWPAASAPTGPTGMLNRSDPFPQEKGNEIVQQRETEAKGLIHVMNSPRTTATDVIQIDIPCESSATQERPTANSVQSEATLPSLPELKAKGPPLPMLPRWCPPGMSHTQKQKLQRL